VLYIPILMSVFNLFFTSVPPLVTGWWERDVPERVVLRRAETYATFKKHTIFTTRRFLLWMAEGLWQGVALFYVLWGLVSTQQSSATDPDVDRLGGGSNILHPSGRSNDMWLLGTIVFLALIVLTNLKMLTSLHHILWLSVGPR
jgi:magnesium-transporting ATPase (P-type)